MDRVTNEFSTAPKTTVKKIIIFCLKNGSSYSPNPTVGMVTIIISKQSTTLSKLPSLMPTRQRQWVKNITLSSSIIKIWRKDNDQTSDLTANRKCQAALRPLRLMILQARTLKYTLDCIRNLKIMKTRSIRNRCSRGFWSWVHIVGWGTSRVNQSTILKMESVSICYFFEIMQYAQSLSFMMLAARMERVMALLASIRIYSCMLPYTDTMDRSSDRAMRQATMRQNSMYFMNACDISQGTAISLFWTFCG